MDAASLECRTICQSKGKETQVKYFYARGLVVRRGQRAEGCERDGEGEPYLWGKIKRARVSLWHKQFTIKSSWGNGNNPIVARATFAFRFCWGVLFFFFLYARESFIYELGKTWLVAYALEGCTSQARKKLQCSEKIELQRLLFFFDMEIM